MRRHSGGVWCNFCGGEHAPVNCPTDEGRGHRTVSDRAPQDAGQDVTPALTPEEWAPHKGPMQIPTSTLALLRVMDLPYRAGFSEAHALAALCLHGQPFGFTQEDVDTLRRLSPDTPLERALGGSWGNPDVEVRMSGDVARRIASIADRIASLLPPETP